MKNIVKKVLSDEYMIKNEGKFFTDRKIIILDKDVDIYTDEGKLLLKFRKNVISTTDSETLYENLKSAAIMNSGRPDASGIPKDGQKYEYVESKSTGKMLHVLRPRVRSGIVGFYDSISNFGRIHNKNNSEILCRKTAYTGKHMEKFKKCLPIFKKIDRIYKKLVPEYYKQQHKAILKINHDFRIKDTIFTTVTVNKNFRTALHRDSGDLKQGFGNLVICSEGEYKGGYTMFPQYGIGIDCRDGDFLAMNVHEWHCNSKITGKGTRVSFVFYLREKMLNTCPRY